MNQQPSTITRRDLLKWVGVAGAGSAALGTNAWAGFNRVAHADETQGDQGTWIPCNCWADCGSKGFNKVLVKDGKAIRMGTDETHPDSPDCPQLRSCARGRSLRGMVFGADRLKYPMKRKGWQPGGGENANGQMRGRDEWERISWEEAYRYIADEVERITAAYGNDSVLIPGYVASLFGNWDIGRLMALHGGYLEHWGACSSGAWGSLAKVYGLAEDTNDRMDLRNAQVIVLWGSNPAWSRTGLPTYDYLQCKAAGTKFVSIDIFRNATAQALEADFVGVRPGTDTALALGMAYVLLTQDSAERPLVDWDFLDRCCVGFDADHMPEGADPKDNFADYVLGTYDGVPKTPEWAAEICGVAPATIEELAVLIGGTERVSIIMSPAPSRTTNGAGWVQAIMTLGAMAGCIGKPGCCCGSDAGHAWLQGGYLTLLTGGSILGEPSWTTSGQFPQIWNPVGGASIEYGVPNGMYKTPEEPNWRVNINEIWTSILDGEFTTGDGKKRPCNVHMIWDGHENTLNQAPGTMLGIEAYRKVDFVVAQNIVMTTTCKYADIVLPVTTQWERYGDFTAAYREQMVWFSQVCEPMFEAKSDLEIACDLAPYLGVDPKEVCPVDHKQQVLNWVAAAQVRKDDGTFENLVSITDDDIAALGYEGAPQEGRVPIQDLKRDGVFTYERRVDDGLDYVVLKDFRDDPEGHPIATTASGKLEIYCQAAVDRVKNCGWNQIDPIATYVPAIEGYEETFSDWDNKVKGEYPYQLVSLHILRHSHSSFANVPNLREAFDHPLYMNPIDAAELNMETGETVLVSSKWGKCLRPLLVTEIMMPGVLGLGQGAWVEIDEETGIDKAGCTNVLNGPNCVECGHQAWNSCIVKVEKWAGEPLQPDCAWEPREVFKED